MRPLMRTSEIREEAIRRGLTTARALADATGVSVATAHKVLASREGDAVLHESILERLTEILGREQETA